MRWIAPSPTYLTLLYAKTLRASFSCVVIKRVVRKVVPYWHTPYVYNRGGNQGVSLRRTQSAPHPIARTF